MKKNSYTEIVNDALKSLSDVTNGNIIVGQTIVTNNGVTIIPLSVVTVGLISGRGEYGEVKLFSKSKKYPHSNAGGGVVSIKPCGFIVEKNLSVKFVQVGEDYFDKTLNYMQNLFEAKNEKV